MPTGTGDGEIKTGIVKREDIPDQMLARTTGVKQPDVIVVGMSIAWVIFIRALRTYLMSVNGVLTAKWTGLLPLPIDEFSALLLVAIKASVAPMAISIIWNSIELLNKVDTKWPEWRA